MGDFTTKETKGIYLKHNKRSSNMLPTLKQSPQGGSRLIPFRRRRCCHLSGYRSADVWCCLRESGSTVELVEVGGKDNWCPGGWPTPMVRGRRILTREHAGQTAVWLCHTTAGQGSCHLGSMPQAVRQGGRDGEKGRQMISHPHSFAKLEKEYTQRCIYVQAGD